MQITLLPAVQILKIAAAHAVIPAENTTALEPCSSAGSYYPEPDLAFSHRGDRTAGYRNAGSQPQPGTDRESMYKNC